VVLEVPLAEHLPKRGTFAVAHDSCAEGTMKSLVLVALLVAASGSYADPKREAAFGFWKGMTLKEAKAAGTLRRGSVAQLARQRATAAGPSPTITIRIAETDLDRARALAAKKGLRYQTYLKMLLHEALDRDESSPSSTR